MRHQQAKNDAFGFAMRCVVCWFFMLFDVSTVVLCKYWTKNHGVSVILFLREKMREPTSNEIQAVGHQKVLKRVEGTGSNS